MVTKTIVAKAKKMGKKQKDNKVKVFNVFNDKSLVSFLFSAFSVPKFFLFQSVLFQLSNIYNEKLLIQEKKLKKSALSMPNSLKTS